MNKIAAFTSSFTPTALRPQFGDAVVCTSRPRIVRHSAVTLQGTMFMPPQPGDAGYKSKQSESKPKESESKKEEPSSGLDLPDLEEMASEVSSTAKRGLELLKEDLFKSAPERAGVGRQDQSSIMKPQYGEPGYKPDDDSIFGKVKGAVEDAVEEVGSTLDDLTDDKKEKKTFRPNLKKGKQKTPIGDYDLPAYLKPLPEDTPREGFTWKNYDGR